MSTFVPLQSLLGGSVLSFQSVWLPGFAGPQPLLIPAAGADAYVYPRDATQITANEVPVYANEDGTGGTLSQPVTADSDGRFPGYVAQPQALDVALSGGPLLPRTVQVGTDGTTVRPARAWTSAWASGQSLAAGVGAVSAHGALAKVAAVRGLPLTSIAVGGAVAHWPTMATNLGNGNGGFAAALQALGSSVKGSAPSQYGRPFYPDGVSSNVLYLLMHGFNHLIAAGGAAANPAEVMAIRTIISRCLTHFIYEIATFGPYSSGGVLFGGTWSAVAATDRNSGPAYYQTSTVGEYALPPLLETSAGSLLPAGSVVAFGGIVQSGESGTVTFHDDTAGVTLGTLNLAAAAPPTSVRTYTPPASGSPTVTFGGQTTAALSRFATAATMQTALQGLSSIGAGNIVVSGGGDGAAVQGEYTFTLQGTLSGTDAAFTASAGIVARIASPWVKRFTVGVDIPAYSPNQLRVTATALGAGSALRLNYMQFETPLPNPVIVCGVVRPPNANTYGFADVPTRDAATTAYNVLLQAMCAEFNQPGLETQARYVELDASFNEQSSLWTWAAILGATDLLHWGEDGHALGAALIDETLLPGLQPPTNQQLRARAA